MHQNLPTFLDQLNTQMEMQKVKSLIKLLYACNRLEIGITFGCVKTWKLHQYVCTNYVITIEQLDNLNTQAEIQKIKVSAWPCTPYQFFCKINDLLARAKSATARRAIIVLR